MALGIIYRCDCLGSRGQELHGKYCPACGRPTAREFVGGQNNCCLQIQAVMVTECVLCSYRGKLGDNFCIICGCKMITISTSVLAFPINVTFVPGEDSDSPPKGGANIHTLSCVEDYARKAELEAMEYDGHRPYPYNE